jgi:hypothetical protein
VLLPVERTVGRFVKMNICLGSTDCGDRNETIEQHSRRNAWLDAEEIIHGDLMSTGHGISVWRGSLRGQGNTCIGEV